VIVTTAFVVASIDAEVWPPKLHEGLNDGFDWLSLQIMQVRVALPEKPLPGTMAIVEVALWPGLIADTGDAVSTKFDIAFTVGF
jgi:hypothetical protein